MFRVTTRHDFCPTFVFLENPGETKRNMGFMQDYYRAYTKHTLSAAMLAKVLEEKCPVCLRSNFLVLSGVLLQRIKPYTL